MPTSVSGRITNRQMQATATWEVKNGEKHSPGLPDHIFAPFLFVTKKKPFWSQDLKTNKQQFLSLSLPLSLSLSLSLSPSLFPPLSLSLSHHRPKGYGARGVVVDGDEVDEEGRAADQAGQQEGGNLKKREREKQWDSLTRPNQQCWHTTRAAPTATPPVAA